MTYLKLLLAITFASAPATEADKMIDRGVDLREAGKDAEALELFTRAYEQGKSPRAMAQIGLAQQALGRWVEAEASLVRALGEPKHPWIKARRAALESALAKVRERVGRLEIFGTPGAAVSIDGRAAGTLPLAAPIPAIAGTVSVEVFAEGYLPVTRSVVVPAGGLARETIELVLRPAEVAAIQEPPPVQKTGEPTTVVTPRAEEGGVSLSAIGYVTGGAAIAAAGVGTAFIFVRNSHVKKYNDDSLCLIGGLTRDQNCSEELDAANSARTVMIASFAAAGALAVTTAVLFVLDSGDEATASRAASTASTFACAPALDRAGVACAGRF